MMEPSIAPLSNLTVSTENNDSQQHQNHFNANSLRKVIGILFVIGISALSLQNNSKNVALTKLIPTVTTELSSENSGKSSLGSEMFEKRQQEQKQNEERNAIEAGKRLDKDSKELPSSKELRPEKDTSPAATDDSDSKKSTASKSTERKYDPAKPLNVVLFYADDWSFNMIGAVNEYLQTPVLDQLGKEGILFTHNCVVASVCMQSRATLYTGQYSMRHQTYKSWADIKMYEPDRWNQTLYPIMMRQNYYVGFFGKYHHSEAFPKGIPVFSKFRSSPYRHYDVRNGVEKHVTQWNEDDGIQFLDDRPRDKPFFMTISFFATHAEDGSKAQYRPMNTSMNLYANNDVPYPKTYTKQHWKKMPYFFNDYNVGRARFHERYATKEMYQHHMKNTCRMITEVDTAIGNMINKLKDQGVYDNTLIIFTTDNGNSHGQHGLAEKWYAYEESLRVPLIIKDPRMPASVIGTRNDEFTLNIDLAPTILSAVGAPVPDVMQGRDIAPLYLDNANTAPTWRKEFLYEFHDSNANIPDSLALVNKEFKYIYWDARNYTQFFNLQKDPFEEFDLLNATEKSLLEEFWKRLVALNSTLLSNHKY